MAGRKKTEDRADERAEELAQAGRTRISARAGREDDEPEVEEDDDDERNPPPPRERSSAGDGSVDLDEDEGEDEDEKPSRRARRQERATLRQQNEEYRQQLAELRGRVDAMQSRPVVVQQQPTQNEPDEYERARRGIHERSRALAVQYQQAGAKQGGMTDAERQQYEDRFDALEEERQELIHKRVSSRGGGQQQGMTPQDVMRVQLQAEYPDLFRPENKRHFDWAAAKYGMAIAEGQPASLELLRSSLRAAQQRLHPTRSRPAPTVERRSRFEGVAARGAAGGTTEESARRVQLTPEQKKMAEAMYRKMPTKKAHKLWYTKFGSKRARA